MILRQTSGHNFQYYKFHCLESQKKKTLASEFLKVSVSTRLLSPSLKYGDRTDDFAVLRII